MDEIKAPVLEQIDRNNKIIREKICEANKTTNQRITNIDRKLDQQTTTMQTKLEDIAEQCKDTKTSIESNVSRLEKNFWGMMSRFEDTEPSPMEYHKSRDETQLKRSVDEVTNPNPDVDTSLTLSVPDDSFQ
jgi:seryl-tRNA synthetase